MTQGIRVKQQLVKGTLLTFGGVDYAVRNKRVAKAMVRDGRPVWSCKPRNNGVKVLSVHDGSSTNLTGSWLLEPGDDPVDAVKALVSTYMAQLEWWVRSCLARA